MVPAPLVKAGTTGEFSPALLTPLEKAGTTGEGPPAILEKLGCLLEILAEAKCLFSGGSHADEPSISLGKAEIEGDRAFKGLLVSNCALNPSRIRFEELGIQGEDEGGQVDCVSVIQGLDTSLQANQSVLALVEVETPCTDEDLDDVDSLSPLMTINPLGLVVSIEVNSKTKVMSFDNTLNVSNCVKHRIPGFSRMMGLSLGRQEKMCIMLLQRLETAIEAANLMHRKDATYRKAVSKDKGKTELRNLISTVNYDGR